MTAEVEWRWSTPVLIEDWAERLTSDDVTTLLATSAGEASAALADLRIVDQLAAAFHEPRLAWECTHQRLTAGGYRSPGFDPGDVYAYLILDRTGSTPHEGSGNVVLADPRAGIQNVFVPGMPWNRSVSMRAEPGRLLGAPGWVSSMVTPLADGETLSWLHMSGTRC